MLESSNVRVSGNSNLVYTIIRKRNIFHLLANLPTDGGTIQKSVATGTKPSLSKQDSQKSADQRVAGEESHIVTLAATPSKFSFAELTKYDASRHLMHSRKMQQEKKNNSKKKSPQIFSAGIDKMTEQEEAHKMSMDMEGASENSESQDAADRRKERLVRKQSSVSSQASTREQAEWRPTSDWVVSWKQKLPLQTIMRLLQVLVPQVEKICIDKWV